MLTYWNDNGELPKSYCPAFVPNCYKSKLCNEVMIDDAECILQMRKVILCIEHDPESAIWNFFLSVGK